MRTTYMNLGCKVLVNIRNHWLSKKRRFYSTPPHTLLMSESLPSSTNQGDVSLPTSNDANDRDHARVSTTETPHDAMGFHGSGPVNNIIVFGETGVGKSSLIEMLYHSPLPKSIVSGDADGFTKEPAPYWIMKDNTNSAYQIWDTPGLNEGRGGSVETVQALQKIHNLVETLSHKKQGVYLLIYCIRASRYRDFLRVNYDLVAKIICEEKVPVVVVINGLENESDMDKWWARNRKQFEKDMKFADHVCVTTTKGKSNGSHYVFQKEFDRSREKVLKKVTKTTPAKQWTAADSATFEAKRAEYMKNYNSRTETEQTLVFRFINSLMSVWK